MPYTDANSVQNPVANATIQSALLDQHRTNAQAIWYPPTAKAQRSTNQSVNDSTDTGIAADFLIRDSHTIHSVVGGVSRFTIPSGWDGEWSIGVCTNWQANGTGQRHTWIRLNGTLEIAGVIDQMGWGGECRQHVSDSWEGVAGDYFEFFTWQDCGAGLNLEPVDYACQTIWARCVRGSSAIAG